MLHKLWGGYPLVGVPSGPGGTRADQGVRPTICAATQNWEDWVTIEVPAP